MHSFFLLAASCITAAAEPQTAGCNCGTQSAAPTANVTYYEPAAAPGGFRARLRNFFGLGSPPVTYSAPMVVQPTPMFAQPAPTAEPSFQTAAPPVTQTAAEAETKTVTAQRPNFTLPEKLQDKVGHETDFSWITGQLFYVRTGGGRWVLRYGQADEVDKYGGSVVLAPTVEMKNFREGDLVCVHGQVVEEGRASPTLGGPLYRVNSINMVDRSDP